MIAEEIMSSRIVTVGMDDSLKVVQEIFENVSFHHLLVMDGNKLQGVISEGDLLKAISPYADSPAELSRDADTLKKRAHQIMSRKPLTIDIDTSIDVAANIFVDKGIACLPVLDKDSSVVGILTWRDVLRAITARQANPATGSEYIDEK